jgi:hypothetical protein
LKHSGLAHLVTGEAPEVTNGFGREAVRTTTAGISNVSAAFTYRLPPCSHAVLELEVV